MIVCHYYHSIFGCCAWQVNFKLNSLFDLQVIHCPCLWISYLVLNFYCSPYFHWVCTIKTRDWTISNSQTNALIYYAIVLWDSQVSRTWCLKPTLPAVDTFAACQAWLHSLQLFSFLTELAEDFIALQ